MTADHRFHAIAFPENFVVKELARAYPDARAQGTKELHLDLGDGGMSLYPFGAVTFRDVPAGVQARELQRLSDLQPRLSAAAVEEDFVVREGPIDRPRLEGGILAIDRLTGPRAEVVALLVAQSAAMEYYERIVDDLFVKTERLVDRLERRGTVTLRMRALHRFIGQAVGTRSEVLSVLHLLDKPDATWDDADMDRIYGELRAEFDLIDRYRSLETKLGAVQESLELVLDVARDRRLFVIELAVMLLIFLEIVAGLLRR